MLDQHMAGTRPRQWNAKWIWPADMAADESNVYAYFRKTFDLEQNPEDHTLFISADRFYQVFINGERLGDGPPPAQPWYHYYDEYDLSERSRQGTNCVAVVVHHVSAQPFGDANGRGRGGLLLEMTDAAGATVVRSDETWRGRRADAWQVNTYQYGNVVSPHVECFDARREPEGWREIVFDDDSWPTVDVIGSKWRVGADLPPAAGPWTKLVPRAIPFMIREPILPERVVTIEESVDLRLDNTNLASGLSMVGQPVQRARCENVESLCEEEDEAIFQSSLDHLELDFGSLYSPAIVLDFGRMITARFRIDLDGPAGGVIDVGYAERLIDGRFNICVDGAELADRYTMKDGPQTFETFTWKGFRYLKLRFRHCQQPVKVRDIRAVISTYPYEERGQFESDDATLNGVFGISKATVRLCSNDFLMADPWREKAQWLGDISLVTQSTIHSCFGDAALTRKFLLQAGQHQFPTGFLANVSNFNSMARHKTWTKVIPDYSLWWVGALLEQFMFTGDEALLHRLYPQALRILDTHLDYLDDRTLIANLPYWVFIDWADVEKNGACSIYNAIFYRSLECWNQLAQFKGDRHTADLTTDLRKTMKSSFDDAFFDEKSGCYVDANIDGKLATKVSEHGNMTPIWAGLCGKERAGELATKVFENSERGTFTEAQPFYMAVVLPALAWAGRFDIALDLIRKRWGKRMLDIGATSVFESWDENGRWTSGTFKGILNSTSCAWAACPADFLIRNLLGIEILEPGCGKLSLAPRKTDFNYQVVFPTPRGDVKAECGDGEVTVSCPDTIKVQEVST